MANLQTNLGIYFGAMSLAGNGNYIEKATNGIIVPCKTALKGIDMLVNSKSLQNFFYEGMNGIENIFHSGMHNISSDLQSTLVTAVITGLVSAGLAQYYKNNFF